MKYKKLPSGVTLVHKRVRGVNGVSIQFVFNAGQSQEPVVKKAGELQPVRHLAHIVEHMLAADASSKRYNLEQKIENRKKYYIWNAYTGPDFMRFVASMNRVYLENYFDEISEYIAEPDFTDEETEKNKTVVAEEMKTKINKLKADRSAFAYTHVVGDKTLQRLAGMESLDLADRIKTITKKDCLNFVSDLLTLDNLTVFVAGNVRQHKVEQLIDKYFVARLNKNRKYALPLNKDNNTFLTPGLMAVNSEQADKNSIIVRFENPLKLDKNKIGIYGQLMYRQFFEYIRTQRDISYGPSLKLDMSEINSSLTADMKFGDIKTEDAINWTLKFFAEKAYKITQEDLDKNVQNNILSYNCDLKDLYWQTYTMYNNVMYNGDRKERKFKERKKAWLSTSLEEYNQICENFMKLNPYIFISAPAEYHIEKLKYEDCLAVLHGEKDCVTLGKTNKEVKKESKKGNKKTADKSQKNPSSAKTKKQKEIEM